ncbi:hypothetical protein M9194_12755 [Vibrio sp. S4M6]|uniref:hypothetical protein n=1 Tax=Vibrio sinus TaxID=2946865 RepID=UPI00202AA3C1|nr:hypothetical protein [Vibrio sinus]MCL9782297.1 hypothetical protein [Vibrio sinus]
MKLKTLALSVISSVFLCSCSQLYHVQLGEIDQTQGELAPFSVKVNEFGLDVSTTARIGSSVATSEAASENMQDFGEIFALMNLGPTTGNAVWNSHFADKIMQLVKAQCPGQKITGLTSVRESSDYGTISGEIVRVDGYCIK